jgi:hypothetical protein
MCDHSSIHLSENLFLKVYNTLRYTTPNVPVRERVKDLRVPTLLVCGERETRFMPNRAFAQGDRILIPSIDVDERLEGDRITGPWVVDQCSTLLLLLGI